MRAMRVGIVVALVVATSVGMLPSDAGAAPRAFTVYAHRGGAGLAPENTLGAFRQTQAQFGHLGVWLELDTQLTRDGHLVVMHDDTVDRTTNCSGAVIRLSLAQLAPCNAADSFAGWPVVEPIPTLRQVLVEGRDAGWRLMVEIKNIPLETNFDLLGTKVADALVRLVRETGFPASRLVVQSFWPLSIDNVELRAPAIRTALLTSSALPGLPVGTGIPVALNALYSFLRRYEIVAPDFKTIDMIPLVVTIAHLLGRQVVTWTPNTPAEIARAIATGADGVISDRPDLVYAALGL